MLLGLLAEHEGHSRQIDMELLFEIGLAPVDASVFVESKSEDYQFEAVVASLCILLVLAVGLIFQISITSLTELLV